MRGGFRKRLHTRLGRVRYLKARQETTGRAMFYRAAIADGAKTIFDAALVAASARYAMLRAREERLSAGETAAWSDVLETVSGKTAPLRLMMITTIAETLGFFTRQIQLLAKSGFQVHAVCAPGGDHGGVEHLAGIAAHRVPMQRRPDPGADCASIGRLLRLMRRVRPDVVHAHTPKAGLLGMSAARIAGVPVRVYTIHGLPLMTRRGIWRRVLEAAERTSCGLATRVYTVSPSLQQVVAELKLCPAEKLGTIGDGSCAGIDIERFSLSIAASERAVALRKDLGIPENAQVLSFMGRIARDKGVAILAAAWEDLSREFPKAHLVVAGIEDSSDPVPAAVLQELRAHDRVHFTAGWVRDMPALYAATDIVVLPTFREGLSQVALEAGAMGVPIVSTRIPGLVNSVQDGVTGLLVSAGEVAPFADAVRRLLNDAALQRALGSAAREYVAGRFSEQRVNQLWISEYRKLVSRSLPRIVNRLAHIETPR